MHNNEPIARNKSLTIIPVKPTIRMPMFILTAWLKGLRSGIFKQGKGHLLDKNGGLCCLGVLQAVTDGDVERYTTPSEAGKPRALPSREWRADKGITFIEASGEQGDVPYLPTLGMHASAANDGLREFTGEWDFPPNTFAEIADAIEACAEGY